ncbi:MAG: hypothetical protein CR995_00545 [Clostridiales bacterium]|nr:MAG: hypothetical protein CR995_00545 [Clostridiales bacterium]
MYLVTLFRIESELRIQDIITQEIDKRVLKSFDDFQSARAYLRDVKNAKLMYNFPFAIIQQMEKGSNWQVLDQKLFLLDEVNMNYDALDDLSILTRTTRKTLHDFSEKVELAM